MRMENEKYTIDEMVDFAKNYSKFYKESRRIIDCLSVCEDNSFIGSQTDFMQVCGYELKRYKMNESKSTTTNTSQFRRLGILKLSEMGIITYTKIDKGYVFKLTDDWVTKIINME